jgi:phosphomannomutase
MDGGIEVTASHKPIDYNGMKLVKADSKPVSGDTGLFAIRDLAQTYSDQEVANGLAAYSSATLTTEQFLAGGCSVDTDKLLASTRYVQTSTMAVYVSHILSCVAFDNFKPLKLVINAGNGAADDAKDAIEAALISNNVPIDFIKVHHQPDGSFPHGIPNPLLLENRADTAKAVIAHQANIGIAWDGDFDRCFMFDEKGEFVEGYYIVGLLAKTLF